MTTKLNPGDWIMEYRRVDAAGAEELMAKYQVVNDGSRIALVPSKTFFDNHALLDNLKYWIEVLDKSKLEFSDVARKSLSVDLHLLQFVLAQMSPEQAECTRLAWEARGKI